MNRLPQDILDLCKDLAIEPNQVIKYTYHLPNLLTDDTMKVTILLHNGQKYTAQVPLDTDLERARGRKPTHTRKA